jgi:hypothetical protein
VRYLLTRLGLRLGGAFAIVLVIAVAIIVGRSVGHSQPPAPLGDPDNGSPSVASSGTSDDDGVRTPAPTVAVTDAGDVKLRADQFVTAWLDRNKTPQAWHDAIARLSTTQLSRSLSGVDPLSVPAARVTSAPTFPILTATFAQAVIGVDTGTVTLTLLKQGSQWLVDGVDWERA